MSDKNPTKLILFPRGRTGSYIVPDTVTAIDGGTFSDSGNLTSVTMGTNLASIGSGAFSGCSSLTSVTFSQSVTNIGANAFYRCICLARVDIPDGVVTIGDNAFNSCSSLTHVSLGNGVTSIGSYAFSAFANLGGVFCPGNAPQRWFIRVLLYRQRFSLYLPGTTGWGSTLGGRPTALWNPQAHASEPAFGVPFNRFGFIVTGTTTFQSSLRPHQGCRARPGRHCSPAPSLMALSISAIPSGLIILRVYTACAARDGNGYGCTIGL